MRINLVWAAITFQIGGGADTVNGITGTITATGNGTLNLNPKTSFLTGNGVSIQDSGNRRNNQLQMQKNIQDRP